MYEDCNGCRQITICVKDRGEKGLRKRKSGKRDRKKQRLK